MGMNRRNVLVMLAAIAIGGGLAVGSGAFSQVSAERTVNVDVAGDGNAFLVLENNSAYVNNDTDADLSLHLGGDNVPGAGFNDNATTTINETFYLRYNGAGNPSAVDLGFGSAGTDVGTASVGNAEVTFRLNTTQIAGTNPPAASVNVTVDTTAASGSGTSDTITIVADNRDSP